MFVKDIEKLRSLINRAAEKGTPFLFAVNFELTEGLFTENPVDQNAVGFAVPLCSNKIVNKLQHKGTILSAKPISPQEYKQQFTVVLEALKRGDTYLANLTVRTPIQCTLSLEQIFMNATAPYQLYVPGRFVCFSPERFVKISSGGTISTNPMKGTIDASVPNAHSVILHDTKETEEHNTIVDLLRNDLSMWAKRVTVDRFRYVERIQAKERDLLQVSSEISGKLPQDFRSNLGNILFDMLPAGSCSGAPKKSTVNVIQKAEGQPRGYYTGVFGFFDGKEMDSAVMIRFIEKDGDNLFFRSGGGITARSECKSEYQEALQKIYLPFQ